MIDEQLYMLYPGDLAIILPGQSFGGEKDLLDIGSISWMHLKLQQFDGNGKMSIGKWSRLCDRECRTIGRILLVNNSPVLSKLKEAGVLFQDIHSEFVNQEIGYTARINQLIDELFILIARQLTKQINSRRDFQQTFLK